mgnify:CR=1 FL=1|jgi:hypothetical protein
MTNIIYLLLFCSSYIINETITTSDIGAIGLLGILATIPTFFPFGVMGSIIGVIITISLIHFLVYKLKLSHWISFVLIALFFVVVFINNAMQFGP